MLCKLKDYIDLLNDLPSCFVEYGIMTSDEAIRIDCSKPDATRKILDKMIECFNGNSHKCVTILKALVDNDQTHIAKFIISSGQNTHSSDRVLNTEEWDAIDQNMFV